jgi:hypothetical protein
MNISARKKQSIIKAGNIYKKDLSKLKNHSNGSSQRHNMHRKYITYSQTRRHVSYG